MHLLTRFDIGQEVVFKQEPSTKALVSSIHVGQTGMRYGISYFNNGERIDDVVDEFELQPVAPDPQATVEGVKLKYVRAVIKCKHEGTAKCKMAAGRCLECVYETYKSIRDDLTASVDTVAPRPPTTQQMVGRGEEILREFPLLKIHDNMISVIVSDAIIESKHLHKA